MLIVNKPGDITTWNLLTLRECSNLSVINQLAPANRLDLLTSGLVAFVVRRADVHLNDKLYLCLVRHSTIAVRVRFSCWLEVKRGWKLCISYFLERASFSSFQLLGAVLITGRKHQLRRQLTSMSVQANERSWCLHSFRLRCTHLDFGCALCGFIV
ncbi:Pseudouridine synthase [Candidatus Hodgkinia cicadicola]|nr:Pseudouridine synthase [Candidatus Hodgkinia cicadicola]